ncbi:MAG: penicillin-binding protein activator [Deltaproteobacteria bacterium]|nr:penicillin-binding protein activator [Deltaproteobacteria bacterium]
MRKAIIALLALLILAPGAHAFWFSDKTKSDDLLVIFEELDLKGADAETVRKLEGYVDSNPRSDYMDEALLRLGRIYKDRKELPKAAETYRLLLFSFPASKFRHDAWIEIGLIEYRTGRLDQAREAFEAVKKDGDASIAQRAKAARFLSEIEKASFGITVPSNLPAIGVLLPLSGDYSSFGEDALSGILLAAGIFGPKAQQVEVIVKDVSDPASVSGAIQELASNPRVLGLIGPLLSTNALDVARQAQMNKLPVITLSQREGVTDAGDYVFRNFLTPEDQARALASHASKELGARRFVVLHPQNSYGTELARHFEMAVMENGGTVVRKASYPHGTSDFTDTVRRIFGVQTKERKEGRRVIREFEPTIQADALFIPDSHEQAALIAPYLEYFSIKGVKLLGSNGWNSPRLVELAGKNVEGAVFVDGFYAMSRRGGTEEFARDYGATFGKSPGILSAHAFDSARMLLHAVAGSGPGYGREDVRDRLRGIKEFRGATGAISFNPRREAVKRLFILTVENGRIVEAGY